ncbi:MAG: DUF819 family protein [Proteobacteria bacterium]|nr:DUF819 family protein [Pseudomonadota bacterium]
MTFSLIGPEQDFALWSTMIGLAAFGFWCERYSWGRKYSGILLLMTLAMVLSNLRIIPTSAPAYHAAWDVLVPIAIPLLLFEANLQRILREAGPTLIAFIIGSAAVVAGVLIGAWALDLGAMEPELAGAYAGTYIGGSLNFAAVAKAIGLQDGSLLGAAIAADNVATNLHFLLLILMPGIAWIAARYPTHHMDTATVTDAGSQPVPHQVSKLSISGLLTAIAIAFGLAAAGDAISGWMNTPQYSIIVTTALTLLVATMFAKPLQNLSCAGEAGNVLMFIFLAGVGATMDIWELVAAGPVLFVFASIIIVVHLLITFSAGWWLKLDLAELIIASAVCIGGPASGAALASAKGWRELLIPGILAGSFGYAIGSFVGISVVEWLRT